MALYVCAYYSALITLFRWINRKKIIVLSYHNIIPDHLFDFAPHLFVSHSQSVFREQARFLRRYFHASTWPPKAGHYRCVITFDDGYKNQWCVAGPILHDFGLPAIFFVPFGPVANREPLVVDQVLKWFSYCPAGDYKIFDDVISIRKDNRLHEYERVYRSLLANPKRWQEIVSELDKKAKFSELGTSAELEALRFMPLSADDLGAMRVANLQIGCHSWDHRPLGVLPPDEVERDFKLCEQRLDQFANSRLYCYPFGSAREVSRKVVECCAASGFEWAFLNVSQLPEGLVSDSRFAVPRTSLPNTASRYILAAKLSGFEAAFNRAIGR